MAQWIILHRNNIFVNRMELPLLCENSGAIYSGSYDRQSDEILVHLKIFKILYGSHW